jgi:hypothetical protein
MGYYRNASGRALSVTIANGEAALVPANCFVKVDPQVERRYDTKRLTTLGLLVRCGRPGASETCIQAAPHQVESAIAPSAFAEALTEFSSQKS